MRKKLLIIHNKMAGRLKAPMLKRVLAQLETQGIEVRLEAANSVEEDIELASSAAREKEFDAVIAAGGDSTIRGVAIGLVGTDMPLGIIPAGTGNVLAQEIRLGGDPEKIAKLLIEGKTRTINMALANGEPFLLMAGMGFDAAIVRDLNHQLKQRIRKAAYIWPTLMSLAAKPPGLHVSFVEDHINQSEEHSYSAAFVVVTRARHYGGSFIIAPDADLADDELQVVMFMNKGRLGMIWALLGLAMGHNSKLEKQVVSKCISVAKRMKTSGVMIRPCTQVCIESVEDVPAQIDGEYLAANVVESHEDHSSPSQKPAVTDRGSVLEINANGGRIQLITP